MSWPVASNLYQAEYVVLLQSDWELLQAPQRAAEEEPDAWSAPLNNIQPHPAIIFSDPHLPLQCSNKAFCTKQPYTVGYSSLNDPPPSPTNPPTRPQTLVHPPPHRARESAEAALADQQAAIAEAAAGIAEAAAAAGEDPDLADPTDPTPGDGVVLVDVEALINAADASIERPAVKSVVDSEVLSYMMDTKLVTKDAIIHAMAVQSMGLLAYTQHESYIVIP